VARLNGSLTAITQATYLGGSASDRASALIIHPVSHELYVAGAAVSANFPGTAGGAQPAHGGGIENVFVSRLSPSLTALVQSTYLGGSASDVPSALGIQPATGDLYVAGVSTSVDFPGTAGGVQSVKPKLEHFFDGFVARLTVTLTTLIQATYLGGTNGTETIAGLVIQPGTGDLYVAGLASSTDLPGVLGGAQPTPRFGDASSRA